MSDAGRASDPSENPAPSLPTASKEPGDRGDIVVKISRGTLAALLGWVRRFLGWSTYGYVGALAVLLLALEWWGERNWLLSVLLYAPPQIFLTPLLALSPLCLLFRWRLLGWHLLAIVAVFFGYMTFRWSSPPPPSSSALTAITFNAGESNLPQFIDFVSRENPDIIFMQDARTRGPALAAKLPGKSVVHLGRFTFISRYPLQKATPVEQAKWQGEPVAVRCETVIEGRPVALYSVHLPTPRYQLSRFLGGRRVLGDLVGKGHREAGFADYRDWIRARIALARSLAEVLAKEPLPVIIGGDFNTPDHGYIYRFFSGPLTDGFAAAGRGWGLTFPGSTRNPITFFGPWLRIDYFFVGRGWKVVECRPEPGGKSQHKAVLARLEPLP